MNKNLIYNITSRDDALQTLENLTGFKKEYWEHYTFEARVMGKDIDKAIEDVISMFDLHIDFEPDNLICVIQQITTSSNECENIIKHGLTDFVTTYSDINSELRRFLEEQKVYIDLKNEQIFYDDECIGSIQYSSNNYTSDYHSKEHYLWSVGRKFYYDFCVCGFYSFDHEHPYGGNVHERPEIIFNIAQLIGKRIDDIWKNTHKCYVVTFKVPFINVHNDFEGDIQKVMLYFAFRNAMYDKTDENIVLVKNGIQIPSKDIVKVERFDFK